MVKIRNVVKAGLIANACLCFAKGKDKTWQRNMQKFILQPNVTVVEGQPQRMVYGSISMPQGSPWCHGDSTYWLVGHQLGETPQCYDLETNTWTTPMIAYMDLKDDLNDLDSHPPNIDRHDCTTFDLNRDGMPDIACSVGAGKGGGFGYTELYLTDLDGSLEKIESHGLQTHPSVRGRFIETLNNHADPENITHVFLSAYGTIRADGLVNHHTMYRMLEREPYFEEVSGPWNIPGKAARLAVVDWNGDGRDDLIVIDKKAWSAFFEQEPGGTFHELNYTQNSRNRKIVAARVADMDMDGINDLIVTTAARYWTHSDVFFPPEVKIFKGVNSKERFDFSETYFRMALPHEAPDIEIVDANQDGIPDIYVVLADKNEEAYCGHPLPWRLRPYPPENWTAPIDEAPDYLLMGMGIGQDEMEDRFLTIPMEFRLPGCGFLANRFGNNHTLLLANGDPGHPGSNAILKWQ